MKKKIDLKRLVLAAMLTAMSVVIGIICKSLLNFADGLFRITFENLPIIISGVVFGPIFGSVVGVASDLISYLLSPQTYPPNLIVTLGAATVGFVSGIIAKFVIKKRGVLQFTVATLAAHIIGSMIIKSIGLFAFYSWLVLWRIPTYIGISAVEILIITLLYRNSAVAKLLDREAEPKRQAAAMTYDEALAYIHGISNTFCKPGLERISALCSALGNPERELKFIHVAGTNGKGSFSSMMSSILIKAGLKVGLFTSPHIVEFGERMKINGENIPNDKLARITEAVKPVADAMEDRPTEFELITAIALLYFKEEKVDVVVFECGLGGRLDSTNIIPKPLLSVITGIALDHTAILGNTVEEIAREKAGIIKGAPVLFGGIDESCAGVISTIANERGSEFYQVDYARLGIKEFGLGGTLFDFGDWKDVKINLLGSYQPRNAAIVLSAVDLLRSGGLEISDEAVYEGLASARWPARFEILKEHPLFIFDGAHNPDGISVAVESIKTYFGDKKLIAISGVLKDKDYDFIASKLSLVIDRAYTIAADNPRALSAEEYRDVLAGYGVNATATRSISEAVKLALEDAKESGKAIVTLGSLYTYGDIIKELGE